ncbi:MAG TPA: orotidine-5'-phosphate decarboxylase [Elusimicrobiota bacterium]|nr:orotidine-5'-phosphate decarboxylase [Elusimicrobiota bacterium]
MRPLIVALDVETDKEALAMARRLKPWVDVFKVGPVLFLKYGSRLIEDLRSEGAEIFLDLKFHDIPSVVRRSVERAAEWGVYSATIHAAGGQAMMRDAASASPRPKLWGVTVLTSLDAGDLQTLGIRRSVRNQVKTLARKACEAGLDGVVSSAREAGDVRAACGPQFQIVTPGIRLAEASDDQKRVETPAEALRRGATFLVMGRPVIEAKDPAAVVQQIYESIEGGRRDTR